MRIKPMGPILFLYMAEQDEINIGVGFLSSALRREGWETRLLVWHVRQGFYEDSLDSILASIKKDAPFCLCISVMSLHASYVKLLMNRIREVFQGPVVVGGYHAIVSPDNLFSHPAVDVVCIGDGEGPLIHFLNACLRGKDAYGIEGLWGKGRYFSSEWQGGHWYVERLEDFPYIDYDLFQEQKSLSDRVNLFFGPSRQTLTVMPAVSGRGCPFRCTYCTNALRLSKFPSARAYLRKYPPELLVEHLKRAVERYRVNFIDFLDELFIYNRQWIRDFAKAYRKQVRIPFSAQVHLELVTDEICEVLTDCGWMLAAFGVECGDEDYRRRYLRRKMSNKLILEKVALLKKFGIHTISLNMMGMPNETAETLETTLRLNKTIDPDVGMHFYWQPLPGTELTQIAMKSGWIPVEVSRNGGLVTNYGSSLLPEKIKLQVEAFYSEFAKEPFSLYSGAPDRLMKSLEEKSLSWIQSNRPTKRLPIKSIVGRCSRAVFSVVRPG
ncbi:MAG: B12-binding domain-containing radical SAM protein [Proteobacteria bacterium]|nr:B12-binding domain-containing radical SAM protein [Pseudomonadota bacterium]